MLWQAVVDYPPAPMMRRLAADRRFQPAIGCDLRPQPTISYPSGSHFEATRRRPEQRFPMSGTPIGVHTEQIHRPPDPGPRHSSAAVRKRSEEFRRRSRVERSNNASMDLRKLVRTSPPVSPSASRTCPARYRPGWFPPEGRCTRPVLRLRRSARSTCDPFQSLCYSDLKDLDGEIWHLFRNWARFVHVVGDPFISDKAERPGSEQARPEVDRSHRWP